MYHQPQTKQRGALVVALFAIALLVAGAAPAAEVAARVTAVVGGADVGDAALDRSAALGEDASIQTAADGNCAMLVDEDALVELCAATIMTLTRRSDTGARVVKVDAGTARIVVEPRMAGEHIEIHTPAAIATIMGTIVVVEVDPVTGETKFTADNLVKVESNDARVTGSTMISNMEQVTIRPGEAPSQAEKKTRKELANLGGCQVDFHEVALSADRTTASEHTQDRLAADDGEQAAQSVASEPPIGPVVGEPGGDEGLGDPELDPFDKGEDSSSSSPPNGENGENGGNGEYYEY